VLAAVLWLAQAAAPAPAPPTAFADAAYLPSLIHVARARGLAGSRDWQVLLHYRPTLWGGWQSQADGPGFFLAGPAGKNDPAAELEATLAAFFQPAPRDPYDPETQHAQCRFPARFAWLKGQLGIDARRLPDRPCPLLDTWLTGIAPEAATLIYASAYLNSPPTMYGHTFLRLTRATGEGNPLLDYAINFAADADTRNGLFYAIRGLTGGFPGHFYVMPYYVKVQEYSNMESRDLWEYRLSLTREQVRRLVLHTWETRTTYFDYFFLTENCSYQLLTLLEVADPSLHLTDGFSRRVIPADTVRAVLAHAGLVQDVRGRPSLVTTMRQRRARLDDHEVDAAEAWAAAHPDGAAPDLTGISAPQQAAVIEAAYDYLRYRTGDKGEPDDDFKRRERRMFLARGQLGLPPEEAVTMRPIIDAPERGHRTLRLSVGFGVSDAAPGFAGTFETLAVRGAVHDFLDPARGYPADAELEMAQLRLRFDNSGAAPRVDRADFINIVSAAPVDRWVRDFSWKVWVGADNARELGCERPGSDRAGWRCLYAGVVTGGGLAVRFGPRRAVLGLFLIETDAAAGPAFADGRYYRVGAGGEAELLANITPSWRLQAGGRLIGYFLGDRRPNLRGHVGQAISLGPRLDLRLGVETAGTYAQATTELLGYF
jgi:hypothetical protein